MTPDPWPEDDWNPATNPQPPLIERRSAVRCASCGAAHALAVGA